MNTIQHRRGLLSRAMICLILLLATSCRKFVDVPIPSNALNGPAVYSSDANATAVMNGLYVSMTSGPALQGLSGISMLGALSADEFTLYSGFSNASIKSYYQNN